MVVGEVPLQRLGQGVVPTTHGATSQVGQHLGVVFPGGHGFQHGRGGDPVEVGDDRRELDPGVFQLLPQPHHGAGAFVGQQRPRPGEVPQVAERLRWDEGGPQQPALGRLAQPHGIGDVGLAARHCFGVPDIYQGQVQFVLQHIERPAPIIAGRFHRHQSDRLLDEPVPQPQK